LELDPSESSALHVMAVHAELGGDTAEALRLWERMQATSGWHIHVENIARVSLALGDLERAKACAEKAVATGHSCYVAARVRAEVRLLTGDREGAAVDAERAVACTPIEYRTRARDVQALRAGLRGERAEARRLFDEHLQHAKVSPAGRSLIGKLVEALGA